VEPKQAALQAEPEGSYMIRAAREFEPTGANMVTIQLGDSLQVLERHSSGWIYCKNLTMPAAVAGWAPAWVAPPEKAEEVSSAAASAPAKAVAPALAPVVPVAPEKSLSGNKPQEAHPKESLRYQQPAVAAAPTPQHASQPTAAQQFRPAPKAAFTAPAAPSSPAVAEAVLPATSQATPPTTQSAPQTVVRAATAAFAATGSQQLSLAAGDLVEVIERDSSGWTYGRKVRQHQAADFAAAVEGWFPDWCCAQK